MTEKQAIEFTVLMLATVGLYEPVLGPQGETIRPAWRVELVGFPEPKRLGLCCYSRHTIQLSRSHIARDNDLDILETISEEIAHALTPGDFHGYRWLDARDKVMRLFTT